MAETIRIDTVEEFPCPHCGAELDASELSAFDRLPCPACGGLVEVPGQIDRFVVHGRLGRGGMGVVFHAEDLELKREVAIKSVRADRLDQGIDFDQLLQEAKSAASLKHPNIATIFSFETSENGVYIVMEFIDGPSLKECLEGTEGLSPAFVTQLGLQLADALREAGHIGLTHSDIKPGNVLIAKDEQTKLVDFGLARFRQEVDPNETLWGSPYYIAPERLNREGETPRSDQYSLGALMWHCLTGHAPFQGATRKETLAMVRAGASESCPRIQSLKPNVPTSLSSTVERMMSLDPGRRYPNYTSLITDLRKAANELNTRTRRRTGARSTPNRGIPAVIWWIAGGLGLLLLAVGIGLMLGKKKQAPAPAPRAPSVRTQPIKPNPPDGRRPTTARPTSKAPVPPSRPSAPRLGANVVGNHSFEAAKSDKTPKQWDFYGKKNGRAIAVVPDPGAFGPKGGTPGKCVEITTHNTQQFGRIAHNLTLQANTAYRLGARVKSLGVQVKTPQAKGALVALRAAENQGPFIVETPSLTGTRDWKTFHVDFRTPARTHEYKLFCTIGLKNKGTGTARFDEIKVQRIYP